MSRIVTKGLQIQNLVDDIAGNWVMEFETFVHLHNNYFSINYSLSFDFQVYPHSITMVGHLNKINVDLVCPIH